MHALLILFVMLLTCLQVQGRHQSSGKIGIWRSPSVSHSFGNTLIKVTQIRGGEKKNDVNDLDEYENIDSADEEEDNEHKEGMFDDQKSLVANTISSIWNKTPPMTQIYVGSSIAATVLSFVLNKNVWPDFLHFSWSDILGGQLWRLCTAFLFFGQLDIFFPLTMQFVWQHMSQLEKLSYKKPEDFVVMVLFGGATLISVYTLLGISTKFLGHNLATYLVYIWSRVFEGSDVNFMDLAILKSEMLPWVFCAQTLLLEQELPLADLIGIAVGHLYYYLKNKDLLKAPESLRQWFQSGVVKAKYAQFKTDFE